MVPLDDVAIVTWASYGCFIVDYKRNESDENPIIYIEVPKTSDFCDVNGVPMCGKHLAKRFKSVIATTLNLSESTLRVKYRESDVHWDKYLSDFAKYRAANQLGYPSSFVDTRSAN